ncbi:hypothetical protein CO662_35295 [Rhizobium anhuiense]|uniref:BON domain-containing protein n=1 Tax=Rhizobium anhuiense TaxID=1184720 RepID=A0ABX4IXS4_9HYPH|nr:BON domain-containing protein [Rhizobium anhuiense]PDS40497.1 hypothetical protein CO668_33790 [Rhizobium anhuiense]PDS47362.1 hypothetical protein CO662_35295 [Rhizobium anhuiense]
MPANTVIPIGDVDLSAAVRRRLELELGLTHDVVKVTVLNGEVTLRGRMACPVKREAAKVTAERVGGVRRVLNDISTAYYMVGSPADRSQEGCDRQMMVVSDPWLAARSPGKRPPDRIST